MNEKHPADIAETIRRLPIEAAVKFLKELPRAEASTVLGEMEEELAARITTWMDPQTVAEIFRRIPSHEVADIAAELTPGDRQEMLGNLAPAESAKVEALLKYPDQSAGGIMRDGFLAFPEAITIGECLNRLQGMSEGGLRGATYLYVVDGAGRIRGVVMVRDLVFRKHERKLGEIMITDVKSVGVDDDQETVAQLFAKYHYLAIPVLDRDGRLVGVVDADRVIRVIQQEATEDMHRMVGLSGEEHAYTPWRQAIGRRMGWLYVNLATAFLAGAVVALFESTIARWTALAVFLPIIAGQGGNSGMQTLTVTVRGMALGEVPRDMAMKILGKEIVMGLLNGLAIGLVTGLLGYWWRGDAVLGIVVGLGMLLNMLFAALSGILIPLSLRCLRIDPALASSIILTTVTDVVGFFAFLGLAALAMKMN